MRQDQYEKLQKLTEQLTDVFLAEADSDKWSGAGIEPSKMDKTTRGDRYYDKKNAAATLTVLIRTTSLIGVIQRRTADGLPPLTGDGERPQDDDQEGSLDADIAAAEKQAKTLMDKLQKKTKAATKT